MQLFNVRKTLPRSLSFYPLPPPHPAARIYYKQQQSQKPLLCYTYDSNNLKCHCYIVHTTATISNAIAILYIRQQQSQKPLLYCTYDSNIAILYIRPQLKSHCYIIHTTATISKAISILYIRQQQSQKPLLYYTYDSSNLKSHCYIIHTTATISNHVGDYRGHCVLTLEWERASERERERGAGQRRLCV